MLKLIFITTVFRVNPAIVFADSQSCTSVLFKPSFLDIFSTAQGKLMDIFEEWRGKLFDSNSAKRHSPIMSINSMILNI